jgi:Cu(I)/Ag(I) efflux system membrane protein CusA/SilA
VFTLEAQEGRLFSPLAFTKTYAMAAAAAVGHADSGADGLPDPRPHPRRAANPLNRCFDRDLPPAARRLVLRVPKLTLVVALVLCWWPACGRCSTSAASSCRRWTKVTCCTCRRRCPACRPGKAVRTAAADRPPDQDRARGASVYGKAGRAETATDPAPLEMFETTIQFKPRDQWRPA